MEPELPDNEGDGKKTRSWPNIIARQNLLIYSIWFVRVCVCVCLCVFFCFLFFFVFTGGGHLLVVVYEYSIVRSQTSEYL